MDKKEPLSKRLVRLRNGKKLTAKAVANLIDIPESTYREWEYGRGLKIPPFQKMSEVFTISVTELITGETPDLNEYLLELERIEKELTLLRLKIGSLI